MNSTYLLNYLRKCQLFWKRLSTFVRTFRVCLFKMPWFFLAIISWKSLSAWIWFARNHPSLDDDFDSLLDWDSSMSDIMCFKFGSTWRFSKGFSSPKSAKYFDYVTFSDLCSLFLREYTMAAPVGKSTCEIWYP